MNVIIELTKVFCIVFIMQQTKCTFKYNDENGSAVILTLRLNHTLNLMYTKLNEYTNIDRKHNFK